MRASLWSALLLLASCAAPATPTSTIPAAAAPTPGAAPAGPVPLQPAVCEGPGRRREFDFWLGSWEVRDAKGAVVGHNRIEAIHGGCAVLESWRSTSGTAGSSLNFFDPARSKWRQIWVDRSAGIVDLEGGLVGEAMVLEGTTLQPDGSTARMRGTWTPLPGGEVRQVFEQADAAGAWTVGFDGMYSRVP
jgi:hypothetical protein